MGCPGGTDGTGRDVVSYLRFPSRFARSIVINIQIECDIDIRTLTSHQVFGQIWGQIFGQVFDQGFGDQKIHCTGLLGQKIQCTLLLGQKKVTR